VRHDEEAARISLEKLDAKARQDERLARLQILRKGKQSETVILSEAETSQQVIDLRKRFTLFPEENVPTTLEKKTKTEVEVGKRKELMKPVSFGSTKIETSWYMNSRKREVVEVAARNMEIKQPTLSPQKTIADLRKERIAREESERRKADELLKKRSNR